MRPFLNLHSSRVGPFPQSLLLLFSKHSQVTELSLSDLSPLWTMQSFLFSLSLLLIQTTLDTVVIHRYIANQNMNIKVQLFKPLSKAKVLDFDIDFRNCIDQ